MKSGTTERTMHRKALLWKSILQQTEEELECILNTLSTTKVDFDAMNTDDLLENFRITAARYLEKTERLKDRVSKYENKLSLINECDTLSCDTAFFDEADAIAMLVKSCSKNVEILSLDIRYYTDSKISD